MDIRYDLRHSTQCASLLLLGPAGYSSTHQTKSPPTRSIRVMATSESTALLPVSRVTPRRSGSCPPPFPYRGAEHSRQKHRLVLCSSSEVRIANEWPGDLAALHLNAPAMSSGGTPSGIAISICSGNGDRGPSAALTSIPRLVRTT